MPHRTYHQVRKEPGKLLPSGYARWKPGPISFLSLPSPLYLMPLTWFYCLHLLTLLQLCPFLLFTSYQNLSVWIKSFYSPTFYLWKHISYCANTPITDTTWFCHPTDHNIKSWLFNKAYKTFLACLSFYSHMSISLPTPHQTTHFITIWSTLSLKLRNVLSCHWSMQMFPEHTALTSSHKFRKHFL